MNGLIQKESKPCCVCGQLIFVPLVRILPCMHCAHQWCNNPDAPCLLCKPAPLPKWKDFLNKMFLGFTGDPYADDPRRSVMMSSSLAFLWLAQPFLRLYAKIWTARPVSYMMGNRLVYLAQQHDLESDMFYVFFVWLYSGFVGMPLASSVALYINGTIGGTVNGAVDAAAVFGLTMAFGYMDSTASIAVFVFIFQKIWTHPSIWDFHWGNCCGVQTTAIVAFFVAFWTAAVSGTTTLQTFGGYKHSPIHAYLISRALFSPQQVDPFSKVAPYIRKACLVLLMAYLVLGRRLFI